MLARVLLAPDSLAFWVDTGSGPSGTLRQLAGVLISSATLPLWSVSSRPMSCRELSTGTDPAVPMANSRRSPSAECLSLGLANPPPSVEQKIEEVQCTGQTEG